MAPRFSPDILAEEQEGWLSHQFKVWNFKGKKNKPIGKAAWVVMLAMGIINPWSHNRSGTEQGLWAIKSLKFC